jgi:hypothetical protein
MSDLHAVIIALDVGAGQHLVLHLLVDPLRPTRSDRQILVEHLSAQRRTQLRVYTPHRLGVSAVKLQLGDYLLPRAIVFELLAPGLATLDSSEVRPLQGGF